MLIQAFPSGPFSTNAYVVACEETGEAILIDSAPGSFPSASLFLDERRLRPKQLLLTHSHWDHIADASRFREFYQLSVCVHRLDAPNVLHPGADGLPCWLSIPSVQPDLLLEEGMCLTVGRAAFLVLHTPGHSPGSVCFYEPQHLLLFSGDTLFQGTIGNLSFPTSEPALMWPSLARLAELPKETRVFPGHGPATTLAKESSWLPFAEKLFDE